jgi:hypothetical protein
MRGPDLRIHADSSRRMPGHFHGSVQVPAGQWDLVIDLSRQGQRLFRSKNRVVLH